MGPAIFLLFMFFIFPIVVDVIISFTDMSASLKVKELTLDNYKRMATRDTKLAKTLSLTFIYVFFTLALFNLTYGMLLALMTTNIPEKMGSFFRSMWLLPRMSPSVVYGLLWAWTIDPTEFGLINQFVHGFLGLPLIDLISDQPLVVIVVSNGFIGASMGMIILTSAIRSIPEHLFHAAQADGAGRIAIIRHIVLPSIRWHISFITVYQTLSLLVSFEYIWLITNGGPYYDTTVYALYIYKRAFEYGQYAYGAALVLVLVLIGIVAALIMWKFFYMDRLLQEPRIEVD